MTEIRVGLIGGTGLHEAFAGESVVARHDVETPFGQPSDTILETRWHDLPVFFLNRHGPGHLLNPSAVPYRANTFALKKLGVTHILASGAVGSLREEFKPRHVVIPEQVIDKTFKRATTFFENAAVHVEFAEPFCPVLRRILKEAADESLNSDVERVVHHRGCYVAMEGPAFSTRAESLMHRLWGGDLIGMTAMPEAKLAREGEIAYALVALVTDYDCWRPHAADAPAAQLLDEIIANLSAAAENAVALMRKAVQVMSGRQDELRTSPALSALRLAIWSDKSKIPQDQVHRLAPLWLKYFDGTSQE